MFNIEMFTNIWYNYFEQKIEQRIFIKSKNGT